MTEPRRTPGQAAFEAFQVARWPLRHVTPWAHPAVVRPAWEAAGEGAIAVGLCTDTAAVLADARRHRDLLETVRRTLVSHREPSTARRLALGIIANAELTEGELIT